MKYTWILLVVLFVILQFKLWIAPGNIFHILDFKKEVIQVQKDNENLRLRNQQLEAEVKNLKYGKAAEEERARNDLGMIKKGEVFYQIAKN